MNASARIRAASRWRSGVSGSIVPAGIGASLSCQRMTTEAAPPAEDAALAEARWNLEPLVDGGGDDAVRALFDEAAAEADEFASTYRDKVAGLDAAGLAEAMRKL